MRLDVLEVAERPFRKAPPQPLAVPPRDTPPEAIASRLAGPPPPRERITTLVHLARHRFGHPLGQDPVTDEFAEGTGCKQYEVTNGRRGHPAVLLLESWRSVKALRAGLCSDANWTVQRRADMHEILNKGEPTIEHGTG